MKTLHKISDLRAELNALKNKNPELKIALVPTMGNLHDGHLKLMQQAKQSADIVVATIFVNRLQFGVGEDFDKYPRTLQADQQKLQSVSVDFLFAPDENELYPQPQNFYVLPDENLQGVLEGKTRPIHFRGVATVVLKLFNIVQPNCAFFGKKDYQQLLILKAMVQQFALPIEIFGVEIARADDGLALSSRNGYLSESERKIAPKLQQTLQQLRQQVLTTSEKNFANLVENSKNALQQQNSLWQVDYIKICDKHNLREIQNLENGVNTNDLIILAAAKLGNTRLIDNLEI